MKQLLPAAAATLLLATTAHAHPTCTVSAGSFRFSSPGPWGAQLSTKAGTTCERTYWSNGLEIRSMSVSAAPERGRVDISVGRFVYTAPASAGQDRFAFRICGTTNGLDPGCTTVQFKVQVD